MVFFQRVRFWINAPEVFDDELLRQVSLINLLIKWGFIFLLFTLVLWPLVANSPNSKQYFYISLVLLGGILVVKGALNRKYVRLAGYLLAMVFWVTFAFAAYKSPDGIASTPFWAAITITPILAGFVNGTISSVVMTLLNWGLGGYLTWLDINQPLQRLLFVEEPFIRYLALMIMASAFPVIVYVWQRNLQDAVEHARISEQALAETAAYRVQNEALEAAVATRTSALEESLVREQHMAEKLALALELETELGELQSRIITVVSHEFRTPLSVISSSAELLHQFYERLSEQRREAAHLRIRESVFYLNDLLKDVTMVDKAQRSTIRPSYQTFSFTELCQKLTHQLLREISDPERVVCNYPQDVNTLVQTDTNLLQQVAANFISNGLKYSNIEEKVVVNFGLDERHLFISVKDCGIGVPRNEQARIFELFYRASNVDERRGMGLGLFIVQAISKLLQGRIRLFSEGEGQGATFEVWLPLTPPLEQMG